MRVFTVLWMYYPGISISASLNILSCLSFINFLLTPELGVLAFNLFCRVWLTCYIFKESCYEILTWVVSPSLALKPFIIFLYILLHTIFSILESKSFWPETLYNVLKIIHLENRIQQCFEHNRFSTIKHTFIHSKVLYWMFNPVDNV